MVRVDCPDTCNKMGRVTSLLCLKLARRQSGLDNKAIRAREVIIHNVVLILSLNVTVIVSGGITMLDWSAGIICKATLEKSGSGRAIHVEPQIYKLFSSFCLLPLIHTLSVLLSIQFDSIYDTRYTICRINGPFK